MRSLALVVLALLLLACSDDEAAVPLDQGSADLTADVSQQDQGSNDMAASDVLPDKGGDLAAADASQDLGADLSAADSTPLDQTADQPASTDATQPDLGAADAASDQAIDSGPGQVQWPAALGGSQYDNATDVVADGQGNVIVRGVYSTPAWVVTQTSSTATSGAGSNGVFVAKFSPNGKLLWVQHAPTGQGITGGGVDVDGTGNIYFAGTFKGTITLGSDTLIATGSGKSDVFVAKLAPATGDYIWAVSGGSPGSDYGFDIAVTAGGHSYVTGKYSETATFGPHSVKSEGVSDAFVAMLDSSGNFQWVASAGGGSLDDGKAIALDSSGNAYLAGRFQLTAKVGTFTLTAAGTVATNDFFVAKLDTLGNWVWAVAGGSAEEDYALRIGVDSAGASYVCGYFFKTATFGAHSLTAAANAGNAVIAKVSSAGSWAWAKQVETSAGSNCFGLEVDSAGPVITGWYMGAATLGGHTLPQAQSSDIYVAHMNFNGTFTWAKRAGGTLSETGADIAMDSAWNFFVVGSFEGKACFGTPCVNSKGLRDGFVARLDKYGIFF